jgi:hypothetical protein
MRFAGKFDPAMAHKLGEVAHQCPRQNDAGQDGSCQISLD